MYWSDCSGPATIQTARIEDGGNRQILVNDYQRSCVVDITIDFDSRLHLIVIACFWDNNVYSLVYLSTVTHRFPLTQFS